MATNLDHFQKDLDSLIEEGNSLRNSMIRIIIGGEAFAKQVKTLYKTEEEVNTFLTTLPDFNRAYEKWYSEALALLKQLLPDRLSDFISFYEKPKSRKHIDSSTYVIQDFLNGIKTGYATLSAAFPKYEQQLAIVKAAKVRFSSSLFEIEQLVQADFLDSEIDTARELLKHKFYRAAGAIVGVALEKHLKQVCKNHSIDIHKKKPTISDLNELLKKNAVIEISDWRRIGFLADIRNQCDHDSKPEPIADKIQDLIDGADKVLKTIA